MPRSSHAFISSTTLGRTSDMIMLIVHSRKIERLKRFPEVVQPERGRPGF